MEHLDICRLDASRFERFYSRAENIDFKEHKMKPPVKDPTLLQKVQHLIRRDPQAEPLLARSFLRLEPPAAHGTTQGIPRVQQASGKAGALPKVRIMQWNILAQGLSQGADNFSRCPPSALVWEKRRLRILEEILVTSPDVVCLQEVDHYGLFEPLLATAGYRGLFYPKPDSPALYTPHSNGPDGCAVFYKHGKLRLLEKDAIVLKAGHRCTNQVCLAVTFRHKVSGKHFSVATTHLKAMKGHETLRHRQGAYLLDYLHYFAGSNPLVVCGDFNASEREPVIKAFRSSDLNLSSASTLLQGGTEEPAYTTWTFRGTPGGEEEVKVTLDYMWYTRDSLEMSAFLEIPRDDDIGNGGIPSHRYPSDHFSLVSDFILER